MKEANPPSFTRANFAELWERLREAEETLAAIRNGEVDAVVVGGDSGQQVYTLENADRPYRVIIEQMREGAITISEHGTILYCNERFSSMLDYTRESLIGLEALQLVSKADQHAFVDLLGSERAGGRSAELSLAHASTMDVPVHFSVVDLDMDVQSTRVICGVVTDLTGSRQRSHDLAAANTRLAAEINERRSAEESLEVALDSAGMGGWDLDMASGVLRSSRRFDEIFGKSDASGKWSMQDLLLCFLPEDRAAVHENFDVANTSGAIEFELQIHRLDDAAIRWVNVKGRLHAQHEQRLLGVVSDVTERRLMDQQLRQAQKMEAIGQLTGGIAHDFNNLLMVIGGSLDMLAREIPAESRATRFLNAARQGVARGALLNSQLLAFSRQQELRVESVCVDELVRSFQSLLERALGETVTLELLPPRGRWLCTTDPHQLETAILNLAINARDAMPGGGTVSISTELMTLDHQRARAMGAAAGRYIAVSIRDTGTGMTPEIAAKVFEPFFTTKPVGRGTGLGLSQVYGFVRQSGGFVTLDTVPGRGTLFTLHFLAATDPERPTGTASLSKIVCGIGTVLVVEDDAAVRDIAMQSLSKLGYDVLEAANATAAIEVMASGIHVDLVFSDVIMAGEMDGIALLHRFRHEYPNVGLLLTSGYTGQATSLKSRTLGFPLLTKPYTLINLSLAVKTSLEQAQEYVVNKSNVGANL